MALSRDDPLSVRVLVDEKPASGAWNMAVDEWLLDLAVTTGQCALRWYRWEEPTLSLGYFQRADDVPSADRFAGLPCVRRLSGGGAILHDRELTYACALGADHPMARRPSSLYGAIHEAIAEALSELGIVLAKRGRTDRDLDGNFLCFQRGDANDLCCGMHKVLGSAQRRRRGAVLQHGSLLLERSPAAPDIPGLCDLNEDPPSIEALLTDLTEATARVLGQEISIETLTEEERRLVIELAAARHIP